MAEWKNEIKQLWFLDFEETAPDAEKIYFSAGWFNGLIEADKEIGVGKIISKFPEEQDVVGDLYRYVVRVKNRLYFCPINAKKFCSYDLIKQEMKTYDFPYNTEYWNSRELKFLKLVLRGTDIYLLPGNYNQILRFNTENEAFTVYDGWFEKFNEIVEYKENPIKFWNFFAKHMVYQDVCIWQVVDTDYFFVFDLSNGETNFIKGMGKKVVSVESNEVDPSILCEDGSCWGYDVKSQKFYCKCTLEIDMEDASMQFSKLGEVFFIPSNTKNMLVIYDLSKKKKSQIEISTNGIEYENSIGQSWKLQFPFIKAKDNKLWLLNKHNEFIEFDMVTQNYITKAYELDNDGLDYPGELYEDRFSTKYNYFPYRSGKVEFLLEILKKKQGIEEKKDNKTCGKKIWDKIKEL